MKFARLFSAFSLLLSSQLLAGESLQEVPVAVSAFTTEFIEDQLSNADENAHLRFLLEANQAGVAVINLGPPSMPGATAIRYYT